MTDRQLISSGARWEPVVGYSRAVRAGRLLVVAGTTAAEAGGGAVGGDDAAAQTREVLRRIAAALEQGGGTLQDVVQTRMSVTDITRWEEVGRAHGEVFGAVRPASSMVEVSGLIDPDLLVEIEALAVLPESAVPPAAGRPPHGLPRYRVLTGPDDAAFCRRVSEALDLGYLLHGGPAATFDGQRVVVAQAVVWAG